MEILSPEYQTYLAQLKKANELFMEKIPEAKDLYSG